MNEAQNVAPVYLRIALDLQAQITSGYYGPGALLPTQAELADAYQVARGTARQALSHLIAQGVAESRQGRGTWVRRPVPARAVPARPERDERGTPVDEPTGLTLAKITVSRREAPADISTALDLPEATPVLIRCRLYLTASGEPAEVRATYLATAIDPGPLARQRPLTDWLAALAKSSGLPAITATSRTKARPARDSEQPLTGLLIENRETILTRGNRPLCHTRTLCPAETTVLTDHYRV